MKMKRKYSKLFEILLTVLVYEAMLQSRVAKCQADSNYNKTENIENNQKLSSNQSNVEKDPHFSSNTVPVSETIHKPDNQVERHLAQSMQSNSSSKSQDVKHWSDLELEGSDKVSVGSDFHENSSQKKDVDIFRSLKNSTQPSEAPIVIVDVWGEDLIRKSSKNSSKKVTPSVEKEDSKVQKASSTQVNARVQKELKLPFIRETPERLSSNRYDRLTTKTLPISDEHANLLSSFEDNLESSLFRMTTPSSRNPLEDTSAPESSDFSESFPGADNQQLQTGFKPLKNPYNKEDDDDLIEKLFEKATFISPTPKKTQLVGVYGRGERHPAGRNTSPQYDAWRSEIVNSKPSAYAWPSAATTTKDIRHQNHGSKQSANIVAAEAFQSDVNSGDSQAGTRKSWNNNEVFLQRLPQAQQSSKLLHQSVNDILSAAERGPTSRLESNSVLFGSAASPTTGTGHSSSSSIDSTTNKFLHRDLQNQPQTIQITAVPNGRLTPNNQLLRVNQLAGLNALGFNPTLNGMWPNTLGGGNGYLDAFGRQIVMVNAERRQVDWSFWIWPMIALVSLPLVLGALFVPIFLKSIVILIQVLQSLGLLLPFSLTQHLAQAATGMMATSAGAHADQVKT